MNNQHHYILRFHNEQSMQQILTHHRQHFTGKLLPSIRGFRLNTFDLKRCIRFCPNVKSIEKDQQIQLKFSLPVYDQWKISQHGGEHHLPYRLPWGIAAVQAREVWRHTLGQNVRIAVIDTGIDAGHPDLQTCFKGGINLVDEQLRPHRFTDENGHGTHIAGTIAAARIGGVVGVAPRAEIYAIKAFDRHGAAYVSDIIKAIEWCVTKQIHIINMSFGMNNHSLALYDAIRFAHQKGIIVIASAGNGGMKSQIDFPANYTETISVGALTAQREPANFSKIGSGVDLYAPGEQILSTWPHAKYKYLNGSSMATAHISGLVALMLSIRKNLSLTHIKSILETSIVERVPNAVQMMRVLLR
jgi:subtilisin